MLVNLRVNARPHRLDVAPTRSLLSVLREELSLTGTRYSCGEGQRGACAVLLDGNADRSCQTSVSSAANKQVTTIEALERDGRLHPVQAAFVDETAMQRRYCTAGMIMASAGLLQATPRPSADDIVRAISGNVCRCGTYPQII